MPTVQFQPTSSTYNFVYNITGNIAGSFTVVTRNNFQTTVSDDADGQVNATTAIGETMFWSYINGPVALVGLSATGDPVILWNDTQYFFLSSAELANNTDIGFTDQLPFTYCFAAGTGIAAPLGEVAVEALRIGDLILTADGRSVPVRWIGRQTVSTMFAGARARPVRIAAGALGDGLPHADLTVTADHGMILDGMVINAGALVNGTTITLVPLAELAARVTYYHVETADHEVILAHGAAAETFVDYAGRAAFDNHAEYLALFGADQGIAEVRLPRITAARLLPQSIRNRLTGVQAAA